MHHAIAAQARSWLGTRFHHQGRLKKTAMHRGGVDCLGLLVGVARELDLRGQDGVSLASADEINYAHQPDTHRLQKHLLRLLQPIAQTDISPGDIILLRIDCSPQHLAIVSDLPGALGIIHAYAPARAVVEHPLDDFWQERIEAAYRLI